MRAEVLSIGDEMTSGQRLDTNSQWLSQRLEELGVNVHFHTTVGDAIDDNIRAFQEAAARADLVIASGGLGPTADDLTREALAGLCGVDLVLDEEALRQIEDMFARRSRAMPPRNRVQAMFPQGSCPIVNPCGTAPGIAITVSGSGGKECLVFALPGVPAEMKEMWRQSVAPAILRRWPNLPIKARRVIKCFGAGESELEAMLPDMIRRGRNPLVGITVSQATIALRIAASGDSIEACQAMLDDTEREIRQCLGDLVFGEEEDELQDAVARLLRQRGQTLATCEWGTQGILATWLSGVQIGKDYAFRDSENHSVALPEGNASACPFFRGGWVTPDPSGWQSLIEFPTSPASGATASSLASLPLELQREWVKGAALALREKLGADYAIAIGPFTANAEGGPDYTLFALAGPEETLIRTSRLLAHPDILIARTAKQALNELRLLLLR